MNQTHCFGVCPAWFACVINNPVRRWLHNTDDIFAGLVRPGFTVIELGCGSGPFTTALAEMVGTLGHVIAADIQPAMLAKVRKRVERAGLQDRVQLHLCGRDQIGLSTRVDFALAFWMLHEVPVALNSLKEVRQLLNQKGKLLLVEPKLHVAKREFQAEVDIAVKAGLTLLTQPSVRLSRAALFAK
jgi:ubiquinone/menaquinone biosynthesis C-methylase UbiE